MLFLDLFIYFFFSLHRHWGKASFTFDFLMVCFDKSPLVRRSKEKRPFTKFTVLLKAKRSKSHSSRDSSIFFIFQRDGLACGMRDGRHDNNKRAKNLKYYFVPEANVGSSSLWRMKGKIKERKAKRRTNGVGEQICHQFMKKNTKLIKRGSIKRQWQNNSRNP